MGRKPRNKHKNEFKTINVSLAKKTSHCTSHMIRGPSAIFYDELETNIQSINQPLILHQIISPENYQKHKESYLKLGLMSFTLICYIYN